MKKRIPMELIIMNRDCDGCCYRNNENESLACTKIKCCYLNEEKRECLVYDKEVNYL